MNVLNNEQLTLYFNLAILVSIGLGALFGFFRGLFKSTYILIVNVGLLLIGWFMSPWVVKMIMGINISSFGIRIDGVDLTTIDSFITNWITNLTVDESQKIILDTIIQEGSLANQLLDQLIFMVMRLAFIIVWLILMKTIFAFISWIIYQIIKPKNKKKGATSRLGGLAVGGVYSLVSIFLFSIVLSGICSLGTSMLYIASNQQTLSDDEAEPQYRLLLTSEEADLYENLPEPLNEYKEYFKFMGDYRNTYSGKISGAIKTKSGTHLDEYVFDEVFSFKFNSNQVKLRSELQTGLKVYSTIMNNTDGELTLAAILAMDDTVLEGILDDLSKMEIVQVAIPIGAEIGKNVFEQKQPDLAQTLDLEEVLSSLLKTDFEKEILLIGDTYLVFEKLHVLEGNEPIGYKVMNFDPALVKEIFDNLGSSEIIKLSSEAGMKYFLESQKFSDFCVKNNINKADLQLDDVTWIEEIANLGNVYEAFRNLGYITTLDEFNKINVTLDNVTEDNINDLATAIYGSKLLSNNSSVLAKTIELQLDPKYQSYLDINNLEKEDLVCVLVLGKMLVSSGFLNGEQTPDIKTLFTDDNIAKMAKYIANSNLITSNIENVIKMLLEQLEMPISISIPDNVVITGSEGETEFINLFTTVKALSEIDFENITSEQIDDISDKISKSNILMGNIDPVLDYYLSNTEITNGIEITISDIDWTSEQGKLEFKNIMKAISLIYESNLLSHPNFTTLTDGTVDTNADGIVDELDANMIKDLALSMSNSIIIRENLSKILNQLVQNMALNFEIKTFTSPDDWTFTELDALLRSVKIIESKTNLPGDLFGLSEREINIILSSRLISESLVAIIQDYTDEDGTLKDYLIVDGVTNWYDENGQTGELRKLVTSAKIILGDSPNFDDPSNLIQINNILSLEDSQLDTILESVILKDSIAHQLIKYGTDTVDEFGNVTTEAVLVVKMTKGDPLWNTEIKSFIKAIKVLLGNTIDLNNLSIDPNVITDLSTGDLDPNDDEVGVVLDSQIITDTIIKQIIKLANPTDGSEAVLIVNLTQDDQRWRDTETEDGEIRKLIRSIKLILGETGNINDPSSINIDKILDLQNSDFDVLCSSYILVDTAVKELQDMTASTGSLYNIIYLPTDSDINYYGTNGELKHFLVSSKYILAENITPEQGIGDLQTISLTSLTGVNQAEILLSLIIKETIIVNVEKVAQTGTTIKIAEELDRDGTNYVEGSWDEELPKLLNSITVFLGPEANINNMDFDVNKFLNLSDTDITTVTNSRVLSYSIVKKIEDERSNETSLISLPDELNPDNVLLYNEDLWYGETGELTKTLKAVRDLGLTSLDANFSLNPIFAEAKGEKQEVILASKVVEATIINKIEKEASSTGSLTGTLIIPENIVWEKTQTDNGELRKFLIAIDIILGGAELENATFSVEKFFGPNQTTLLASRVVEESVINKIDSETKVDGNLYNTLVYPTNFTHEDWYGDTGELRKFLAAIEIIIGTGTFETTTFEVDKFLGPDQTTLLDSRIIEASSIKYIKESNKLIIPDQTNVTEYYYFTDEAIIWERSYDNGGILTDIGELRRFFNGIDELVGVGTYEAMTFNMDDMLDKDFTIVLESRVLEATIADMINDLISGTGVLTGFIKQPTNGYQWYFHETSLETGLTGEVRRGEFVLTTTTLQTSDLEGFLISIQQMNTTGLNFNTITLSNVVGCDNALLASALFDYSRVMRGSIATMLNEVIARANIDPAFAYLIPIFTDEQFTTKEDVITALDQLDTFFGVINA